MFGPELLNLTVRPTPIFLEGTASLRIDQPGPRELGLTNFQIVKGIVSVDRGQLFINLAGVAQSLLAPDIFRRYAGQNLQFRVHLTADGATVLRPLPAAPPLVVSPPPSANSTAFRQLTGTPATILRQLMAPESLRAMPPAMAAVLAGLGVILSSAMPIETQIARAREMLGRGGIFKLPVGAEVTSRASTLPAILLRMLGFAGDSATTERARGLVTDIESRQERAATALRSEVINADILSWVNGASVELNLQRGPKGNPPGNPPWIINLYTQFSKESDVWLRVEHVPVKTVRIDAWLTDPEVFARARDSRSDLFAEVAEFGLQLEHFAVFNQARDVFEDPLAPESEVASGERVDASV